VVSISQESPGETTARLTAVLADADVVALPGSWSYQVCAPGESIQLDENTLAAVADRDSCSLLRPARAEDLERFSVFEVHFPDGVDNSGFVGWLASEFKSRLGTGVAVICGYNPQRGGVYDYWLVPEQLRAEARGVLSALAADG
jgi:hypothetical protein